MEEYLQERIREQVEISRAFVALVRNIKNVVGGKDE